MAKAEGLFAEVRRRWRVALILLAVVFFPPVGCYLHLRSDYHLCDRALPEVRQGPHGDRIEIESRFCGFFTGGPQTVVLRRHGGIIFAYDVSQSSITSDLNGYPDVVWSGPREVTISIDRVEQIQRRRFKQGATRFTYKIGTVEYQPLR